MKFSNHNKLVKKAMAILLKTPDQIPGGMADGKPDHIFDPKQIDMGVDVEKEHTDNPDLAREIAKDHLVEIKDYYTRLKKMEQDAEAEEKQEKKCPIKKQVKKQLKKQKRKGK